jgi:predicted AlkP superfamily pyrophosphatase or phosphodiesterase
MEESAMRKEFPITSVAPTVSAILDVAAPAEAKDPIIGEMAADLSACSRVAILAPDALGDFAFRQWKEEMPFLNAFYAQHNVLLRSVVPTITPVNFAAIVSGANPPVHGVKTLNDDIQCESLFDVVRAAGGRSAGIGREGYTGAELLGRHADISGRGPAAEKDAGVERLVLQIVDKDAPQFLIAQLGITDDVFHQFGPSSPDVVPVLRETDERLQRLSAHLIALGYGIIVLADHGQHDVEKDGRITGSHGTDCDADSLVPCTWAVS